MRTHITYGRAGGVRDFVSQSSIRSCVENKRVVFLLLVVLQFISSFDGPRVSSIRPILAASHEPVSSILIFSERPWLESTKGNLIPPSRALATYKSIPLQYACRTCIHAHVISPSLSLGNSGARATIQDIIYNDKRYVRVGFFLFWTYCTLDMYAHESLLWQYLPFIHSHAYWRLSMLCSRQD